VINEGKMIYRIEHEREDGSLELSERDSWMMQYPTVVDPQHPFKPGDIVRFKEGYFVLNGDLNPMQIATEKELDRAEQS
jgi:hypothetical protein